MPSGSGGTHSRQGGQPEPPTSTPQQPNARSARSSAYPHEGDPAHGERHPLPRDRRTGGTPLGVAPGRRAGYRRGAGPPRRRRPELRRHVLPHRALSRTPPRGHGRRGGRRHRGRRPRRHRLRRGRPRDLHRQPAGRLQHRARHGRRPADQAARRHPLRDRRRHDDARPHLCVPAPPDRTPRPRRHRPAARGGRRRRSHLHPVGAAARRERDRHRLHRREGRDRPGPRLHAHHRLPPRGRRRRGSASSPTARASRWSSTASADDVRRLAGLAQPARAAGLLRDGVRPDPADRRDAAGRQGLAVRHPPRAGRLHRRPRGARGARRRALRPRRLRPHHASRSTSATPSTTPSRRTATSSPAAASAPPSSSSSPDHPHHPPR